MSVHIQTVIYLILMSTNAPILIERSNLSLAWADAFLLAVESRRMLRPLVLTLGDFTSLLPPEDLSLRRTLDEHLAALDKNPCHISAMTIFPYKVWIRRGMPHCDEFSKLCISRLLPRLQVLNRSNQNGTYFGRMMAYSGTKASGPREINQLQFVIDLMKKGKARPRQSALQIACFDPAKDHTGQTRRGFPCLQQLSLAYDDDGNFALNAYYPTQFIFDRGYGNYLGLCHLGHFLARETSLRFSRLTCFVGRPELGEVRKCDIQSLIQKARIATQNNGIVDNSQREE
jgi:hypothetical protein